MTRDWSLGSGERRPSPDWAEANVSHRSRYEWARSVVGRLGDDGAAADVFSGTGYGTAYLAEHCRGAWTGIEGSAEAVAVATKAHPGVTFRAVQWPAPLGLSGLGAVVSLESLEHVADPAAFLADVAGALVLGGTLALSTPNETALPLAIVKNKFHVQHFTRDALESLLTDAGFDVACWYGQDIHAMYGPRRRGRIPDELQSVRPWAHEMQQHCVHALRVR